MTTETTVENSRPESQNTQRNKPLSNLLRIELIFPVSTVLVIMVLIDLNFIKLFERYSLSNVINFIATYFLPPDFSPAVNSNIQRAMFETIQMALVGTYFGFLLSLPLSIMAAKNLMPGYLSTPMRMILASIRTVPSLIWAIFFVIIFGLGPRSGTLALIFYTVGYLGKWQYETFEGLKAESFEALRALGANKIQLIRYVALPDSANELISQVIFMFEYNIRSSSIIGFVGAGGVRFLMNKYLSFFQFHALTTALIYILATVVIIDFIGGRIREAYQDPNFKEISI